MANGQCPMCGGTGVQPERPWWFEDDRVHSHQHAELIRAELTPSQRARWDAGDVAVLDEVLPWDYA